MSMRRHVEELLGDLADVLEVAPGQGQAVGDEPAGAYGERAHAAISSGLAVRERKTSSSVARRRCMSRAATLERRCAT
jgi:hypothetical protein